MQLRARSHLRVDARSVYRWHLSPGAFLSLMPPWESLRLVGPDTGIWPGCVRQLRVTPLGIPWWALHDQFEEGRHFRDLQQRGPCKRWAHRHRFEPDGEGACWLNDEVDFELPLAPLSSLVLPLLRAQFQAMFLYRHRVTADFLRIPWSGAPLRLAVTGSSGLIGRQLVPFLTTAGHRVLRLVRRPAQGPDEVYWNPSEDRVSPELEGLDGLIHLAGKGVLDGNFGRAHRNEIWSSRVDATEHLVAGLARLQQPPRVFLSASGIGYYGNRADSVCEEDSSRGDGFLADVCEAWERASLPLEKRGTRRVVVRLGAVLNLRGGALPLLYYSALCGPTWRIGDGQQPFSWVAMEDVLGMIGEALIDPRWSGCFNGVAPQPTTLGEWARAVGDSLGGRPQFSLPEKFVKFVLGQRAELFFGSCRARPSRALALNYSFRSPDLMGCLSHGLGRYRTQDLPPSWSFHWGAQ